MATLTFHRYSVQMRSNYLEFILLYAAKPQAYILLETIQAVPWGSGEEAVSWRGRD